MSKCFTICLFLAFFVQACKARRKRLRFTIENAESKSFSRVSLNRRGHLKSLKIKHEERSTCPAGSKEEKAKYSVSVNGKHRKEFSTKLCRENND